MAKSKGTQPCVKRKRNAFPETKGKIVESIELSPLEAGYSIGIKFQDRAGADGSFLEHRRTYKSALKSAIISLIFSVQHDPCCIQWKKQ
jgi:hypothetical protein